MIREIVTIGHPILRKPTREVGIEELSTQEVQSFIDDLIETMRAANGAGLAANQVASPLRIAAIEVGNNPRYPYKPRIPLTVVVNPIIEPVDDEQFVNNEGCLSVPNLRGDVRRYVSIRVRYLDRHGVAHDEIKRGLTAGTFQHECDHLDGKLFVDKVFDTSTLATWDSFNQYQREAFVERITKFVEEIGS